MSNKFQSVTLIASLSAVGIACASFYLQLNQGPQPYAPLYDDALDTSKVELSQIIDQSNQGQIDAQQLQKALSELNQKIARLEARLNHQQVPEQLITQAVDAYVAKREEREKQKRAEQDPFRSFYENLPEDYEQRLKTDPEYAAQMKADLRSKVLDTNLSDEERLQAMAQLQMTVGILADFSSLDDSTDLSDAVMQIATQTNDEKTRIRALETVTAGPVNNPKLMPTFMNLLNNDSNTYVRNLAANGLGMIMYSRRLDNTSRQQLANTIVNTMRTTSDARLKQILEQNFGSENDIAEMLRHMQEEPKG